MSTQSIDNISLRPGMRKRLSSDFSKVIAEVQEKIESNLWLTFLNEDIYYDSRVNGLLPIFHKHDNFVCDINDNLSTIEAKLRQNFGKQFNWKLITRKEIEQAIISKSPAPYKKGKESSIYMKRREIVFTICQSDEQIVCLGLNHILQEQSVNIIEIREILSLDEFSSFATLIPIVRFGSDFGNQRPSSSVLLQMLRRGLVPEGLQHEREYLRLMNYVLKGLKKMGPRNSQISLDEALEEGEKIIFSQNLEEILLSDDLQRAGIQRYPSKILVDANRGHWEIWPTSNSSASIQLERPLVARDPASSIIDGVVGIDFGTKSTVVVAQKESLHSQPLRIGTGNYEHPISKSHYENPTIIECNNLLAFWDSYQEESGRPFTSWNDVTVSHAALNALQGSATSNDYYAYIRDIKQWAGDKQQKRNVVDKQGTLFPLPPYYQLEPGDIDPLEIYAYYLGLYINNQHDGIYLNYYLSFPITYELAIRRKITASFRRGLQKSLPPALLENSEAMSSFRVRRGASEPAAYAITALHYYRFEPEENEEVLYGIFDFGGGTTDFDFGLWREADSKNERRYDYVIEHFGAGGDRFLGGERLLELLAFEIFKENREILQKDDIQFYRPQECFDFSGSELLLNDSREAHMNMTLLSEKLRPFWEDDGGHNEDFSNGIHLNLWDSRGEQRANYRLSCDPEQLKSIICKRINRGVKTFLETAHRVFSQRRGGDQISEEIHIFLAGNSSQSLWLQEIFASLIASKNKELLAAGQEQLGFELYPPLGTPASLKIMEQRGSIYAGGEEDIPTGKTGVAFGLIRSRKGSRIKVIDQNICDNEINCPYYIGSERKGRFIIELDRELPYGEWHQFIDAGEEEFEIYYTDQLAANNKLNITDQTIRVKRLLIDIIDENAWVYLRKKSPSILQYVVAYPEDIASENYLGKILSFELTA